jgi:cytochrome c553
MKVIGLHSAMLTAILAIALALAGSADVSGRTAPRPRVSSKIEYCKDCHGASGQGYHGYLIMPRLAGQTPEYFENQLRAFAERTRERALFINMSRVHGMSPELRASLAAQFRGLNPSPFGGGPSHLVATGKQIFQEGAPESNVPACAACHGPEGQGEGPNARLAGQLFPYTIKELKNWSSERGADAQAAIMAPIARALSESQIVAIAAYLSYLK